MELFLWISVAIFFYIIIGAGLWTYWDSEKETLLKQATKDHELLPMALILAWPVFLWKWLSA